MISGTEGRLTPMGNYKTLAVGYSGESSFVCDIEDMFEEYRGMRPLADRTASGREVVSARDEFGG